MCAWLAACIPAGIKLLPETYVVLMFGLLNQPQPDVRAATEWYRKMEAEGADPDQVVWFRAKSDLDR